MTEENLEKFLEKVDQLQRMVQTLDDIPGRRESLAGCIDHNQVVHLAKSWGFEIGRRWGDIECDERLKDGENLLNRPIPDNGHEQKYCIREETDWRLELNTSCLISNDKDFWNQQILVSWHPRIDLYLFFYPIM